MGNLVECTKCDATGATPLILDNGDIDWDLCQVCEGSGYLEEEDEDE